jgi:hypothetical protein
MKPFGLASSQAGPSLVPSHVRQSALDRCAKEQAEILNRSDVASGAAPAWLVTLGIEDWEMEKRFIAHVERTAPVSTENSVEAKTC